MFVFALNQVVCVCRLFVRTVEHSGVLDIFLKTNRVDLAVVYFHAENAVHGANLELRVVILGVDVCDESFLEKGSRRSRAKSQSGSNAPVRVAFVNHLLCFLSFQLRKVMLASRFIVLHTLKLAASCAQKQRVQIKVLVALFQKFQPRDQ